ncbi:TetR family transcriptional regulator [Nocardioides baekrokdamisoli]|uniref:TetR family transcriptional regulator n=1 Tax=Nocardioides baekrokdamisoli TaxID=1804624 RepID=A0A3G9J089_9ACTN|nr:TetR family transcriptional regulator [Nocardioides baekrokdamisoli]BBH16389.1 TetR family transcriptional regulator [Nocardioides baekrokdamisoli]
MTETASRADQKARTRQAILDAALTLTADSSLVALSLRQVAKEVGIVPTAFYRHFASVDDLGLALVDESFALLRAMLRDVRRPEAGATFIGIADASVEILADHVSRQRAHYVFIARELVAGPAPVRDAIRLEIERAEGDLATDLARVPATREWSTSDLHALSALIVSAMVGTAQSMATARPEQAARIADQARTQLRMVLIGAFSWRSGERD